MQLKITRFSRWNLRPLKNWKTAARFEKVDQLDSGHSSFCLFLVQIPPQAFLLINACFSCSSTYKSYITDLRTNSTLESKVPYLTLSKLAHAFSSFTSPAVKSTPLAATTGCSILASFLSVLKNHLAKKIKLGCTVHFRDILLTKVI